MKMGGTCDEEGDGCDIEYLFKVDEIIDNPISFNNINDEYFDEQVTADLNQE